MPHKRKLGTKGEWPELIQATVKESTNPNPRWIQSKLADNITHNTNNAAVFSAKNSEDTGLVLVPIMRYVFDYIVSELLHLSKKKPTGAFE